MKKITSIIVALLITVSMMPTQAGASMSETVEQKTRANYNDAMESAKIQMLEAYEQEKDAIDAYDELIVQMEVAGESFSEEPQMKYLENYGGAYLGENGELIVYMTDLPEENDAARRYADVIKQSAYSLNDLKMAHEQLREYMTNYKSMYEPGTKEYEMFSSVVKTYTDQANNCVSVEMEGLTSEKAAAFEAVFQDNATKYQLSDAGSVVLTATLRPGGKLYDTSTGSGYGSIGFRAKYGTKTGFVTAQHVIGKGDAAYCAYGTSRSKVGTGLVEVCGGKSEATFVEVTNSSFTPGNTAAYSNDTGSDNEAPTISSTYYSGSNSLLTGSTVYKVGATSFFTAGKYITDDAALYRNGSLFISDMLQHDALTLPGDSGGCVFTYRNNKNIILGTTTAGTYDANNNFVSAVISQAKYTVSALGISLY